MNHILFLSVCQRWRTGVVWNAFWGLSCRRLDLIYWCSDLTSEFSNPSCIIWVLGMLFLLPKLCSLPGSCPALELWIINPLAVSSCCVIAEFLEQLLQSSCAVPRLSLHAHSGHVLPHQGLIRDWLEILGLVQIFLALSTWMKYLTRLTQQPYTQNKWGRNSKPAALWVHRVRHHGPEGQRGFGPNPKGCPGLSSAYLRGLERGHRKCERWKQSNLCWCCCSQNQYFIDCVLSGSRGSCALPSVLSLRDICR